MKKEVYLCIHGHFYQPPRENAWTEEIELQESAYPHHDWNERIYHECYKQNATARITDDKGNVLNIVNNYEKISFNFGPTLLSWLEKKHPNTYKLIQKADKESIKAHKGHGNAIAQAYNHMILPLANRRDKVTQVKWGIRDFQKRFKRFPESIWLPETACNEETLEVLVEEGIKFIILEPHQAESVCKMGTTHYTDVSSGNINPKVPYRCYLKNYPEKFIDIFFFDGPVSKAVGFEELLFDAKLFMNRIESAITNEERQLIHIATDGETYGHHKAFGERALAYLLNVEITDKNIHVTNYGEHLENFPPQYKVKLKSGENGEGTSWSCSHGVKRWKDHCGCRGDGPAEWNQYWRAPLRTAFDYLRDSFQSLFENHGSVFFKSPWDARNDYVDVVLDRSDEAIKSFFNKHSKYNLNQDEIILCLKLLEMQRHLMLMYTSCAWFFTELSGIETVQVMQYAARALGLAKHVSGTFNIDVEAIEKQFFKLLKYAKSNVNEFKDGAAIFKKFVIPSITSMEKIVAHYAIKSIFENFEISIDFSCFKIDTLQSRTESFGNITLSLGRVKIQSKITLEERDLAYIVLQFNAFDFRCSVKRYDSLSNPQEIEDKLFDGLYHLHVVDLLRTIDRSFGEQYYSLKDLFQADRAKIVSQLTKETLDKISSMYENIYEENRRINEIYRTVNIPIPKEFHFVTEFALNRKLMMELHYLAEESFNKNKFQTVFKIADIAKSSNVKVNLNDVKDFLSSHIERRINDLTKNVDFKFSTKSTNEYIDQLIQEGIDILDLAKNLGIEANISVSQMSLFYYINYLTQNPELMHKVYPSVLKNLLTLGTNLKINVNSFGEKVRLVTEQGLNVTI